jgi:hypothetical protein
MSPERKEKRAEYMKEYYKRNREKWLADSKARYEADKDYFKTKNYRRKTELRDMVTEIKKKSSCARCGFGDHRALQFHHRDGTEKKFGMGSIKSNGVGAKQLEEELAKCDILCANCHMILHYKEE